MSIDGVWIGFLAAGLIVVALYRAIPSRRRRAVDALILRLDIPVTDRIIGLIDRRFRSEIGGIVLGGFLGLALIDIASRASGGGVVTGRAGYLPPLLFLVAMALGGAFAAVRQFAVPTGYGPRLARAAVPRLADYLHPVWLWLGVGLTAVALGGAVLAAVGVGPDVGTEWAPPIPLPGVLGAAAASLIVLLGVAALSRRLLAVPQPAGNERELRWDDALRGIALHTLWLCPVVLGLAASVLALDWVLPYSPGSRLVFTIGGALLPIAFFGLRLSRRSERRLWPTASRNSELADPVPYSP